MLTYIFTFKNTSTTEIYAYGHTRSLLDALPIYEERLLGVSLTGVCDNLNLFGEADVLATLRETVVETNKEWADRLGIAPSVATTCVKHSGTVSQLVNSSSGLHTRHSPSYLRTVRADNKENRKRVV